MQFEICIFKTLGNRQIRILTPERQRRELDREFQRCAESPQKPLQNLTNQGMYCEKSAQNFRMGHPKELEK